VSGSSCGCRLDLTATGRWLTAENEFGDRDRKPVKHKPSTGMVEEMPVGRLDCQETTRKG
jgi:hypothetical protein